MRTSGGRQAAEGAVVYLVPPAPAGVRVEPSPAPPVLSQNAKTFVPAVVAVVAGNAVEFPNYDRVHHNVFSLSDTKAFDLGLYRNGATRSVTFDKQGAVQVFCNIHEQMAAHVKVLPNTVFGVTGPSGSVTFTGLPAQTARFVVWHPQGQEREVTAVIRPGGATAVEAEYDASTWKRQPHLNKYGEEYPDDEENRY
ncbi:MAG: methylamine utilization protein [Candidatus Schekmanbacteria bacterium]|nr:methylamine utilization protein [Candidatus Schekmanbacteria bacterium]